MGLFKNQNIKHRELNDFDHKIKVMYSDGINDLTQNISCEIALKENKIIINPLSGPERKIYIDIPQISSVSVLPWGEYALKYLHTNISVSKNSPGRTYLVINFISSESIPKTISFWGAMHLLQIQKFAEQMENQILEKSIHL